MSEGSGDRRSELVQLVNRRDSIEAEILNFQRELQKHNIGMHEPLVDAEGYPRKDVDIYTVRQLRHDIICRTNDCKNLTSQIEEGLYALHSEESAKNVSVDQAAKETERAKPFAKVDIVHEHSPAHAANVCVGDLIVKFDTITANNFQNLVSLANIVSNNIQKPIRVNVLRKGELVPLILVPDKWSGPGYLGCKILPV